MIEHEFDDVSSIPLPKEGWDYESILLFSKTEVFINLARDYTDSPGFENAFPDATSEMIEEAISGDWKAPISKVFAHFELERAKDA